MIQEYKITDIVIDLKDMDKSVFLPTDAKILEVNYQVVFLSIVYQIGGVDRLTLFRALEHRVSLCADWECRKKLLEEAGFRDLGFCQYDPSIFKETRMVIKALVPVPKPKGKYA